MKNHTDPERGRRKPAQAARKTPLKVTHDKYAELYDVAPISYITLDRKGAVRSVNLIGAGLLGMARSRIVGRRFRLFVSAGDRPAFDLFLEEVFATRAIRRCELALSRKRKAPLFVRLDATVSKDGHECRAVLSDITECKRATEALRRSERFAQETIDALTAHICLLNDSGTIIAVNKGWRDFAAANQLAPQNVAEGVNYLAVCDAATGPDAAEAAAFAAGIRAVMKGEREDFSLEYPCHSPNEQRWFIGQVTHLLKKGPAQIVVAHDNITGRKKAEEALRVANQEWRSTFDAVNSGICLVDRDRKILRCNRAFADLFRQMPAQLIGSNCCELLHGSALPFAGCPLLQAKQSRRRETGEIALGERWYEIVVDPILDETGEFQGAVHIINDITERKRAEQALKASEANYRRLYEGMRDAFVGVNMDGQLLEFNEVYRTMLGYEQEELLGLTYMDLTPEKWHASEADIVKEQVLPRGYSDIYQKEYQHKDGTVFPVELRTVLLRDDAGQPMAMWAIVRDITERKQAEEALRDSENRFRSYFELPLIGIAITSPQEGWLKVNDRICTMLGYSREELHRMTWAELTYPEDLAADVEQFHRTLAGDIDGYSMDKRFVRKDGRIIWTSIAIRSVRKSDGSVDYFVGLLQDITERKQAEESLRESQTQLRSLAARLQAVREEERTLVAREIHDVLAQDLTRLKMDIAWLSRRMARPLDEEKRQLVREKLAAMTDLTDTAIHSVQKIATELRPLVLDSLGLVAAIEWQAKEFKERTGIQCEVLLPEKAISLDRDRSTAIFRILQESLTNVVRHAAATRVEIQLECESDQVTLCVRDNGRGIRPHEHKDPHSIGLLGMRERALSLHGQCEITGRPGEGTTVKVRLPLPQNDGSEEQP